MRPAPFGWGWTFFVRYRNRTHHAFYPFSTTDLESTQTRAQWMLIEDHSILFVNANNTFITNLWNHFIFPSAIPCGRTHVENEGAVDSHKFLEQNQHMGSFFANSRNQQLAHAIEAQQRRREQRAPSAAIVCDDHKQSKLQQYQEVVKHPNEKSCNRIAQPK